MNVKIKIKKLEKYISAYTIFKALYKNDKTISFLDSSLKNKYGKYSIMGLDLYLELKEKDGKFYINNKQSNYKFEEYLIEFLKENKEANETKLPIISGGIGYFSYDYGMKFENIKTKHKKQLDIPEVILRFYDTFIIEDLENKELFIAYKNEKVFLKLKKLIENLKFENIEISKNNFLAKYHSNFLKNEYLNAIKKLINFMAKGDIYVVNMTQRLEAVTKKSAIEIFEYLKAFNPAPFSAYLDYGDFQIISSSPERFLNIKDKVVETRPIKGTRKRGRDKKDDERLKLELLNSKKDKSELSMIVDLERNDLNKVCKPGSVNVEKNFEIEAYATVFHLVSTIKGKLKDDCGFVELLQATFPGGSITGAPKIRAMELIDEVENSRRGIYTGSLGYIAFNGDCDLNIIIRSILKHDKQCFLGVGGGITFESDLEFEYEESLQKAKAILEALSDR